MPELKPGRALDALVAEKVMGCIGAAASKECNCSNGAHAPYEVEPGEWFGHYSGIKEYSTDIAAAWEVVEKLHTLGFDSEHEDFISDGANVRTYRFMFHPSKDLETPFLDFSPSPPHAICLAALKAVGWKGE